MGAVISSRMNICMYVCDLLICIHLTVYENMDKYPDIMLQLPGM